MKKAAIVVLMAAFFSSCATSPTLTSDQLVVQRIIDAPGKSSGELFDASITWINKSFRSAQAVISYQDRASGKIIGKGNASVMYTFAPVTTTFSLTVEVKDGRARITIDSPVMEITVNTATSRQPPNTAEVFGKFRVKAEEIIDSYAKALSSKKDESW